jgi:hypothetical protein
VLGDSIDELGVLLRRERTLIAAGLCRDGRFGARVDF